MADTAQFDPDGTMREHKRLLEVAMLRIWDMLLDADIQPDPTVQSLQGQRIPEMVERLIARYKVALGQWKDFAKQAADLRAEREALAQGVKRYAAAKAAHYWPDLLELADRILAEREGR